MIDYDSIIDKYQGKGLPYRDRNDDIRGIVLNLCRHIYYQDSIVISDLVSQYKCFKFINDIRINGHTCTIEYDEGVVSFQVFPKGFYANFCSYVFGFFDIIGQCHNVTQKVLEECHCDNISAITSLCINTNFITYFHSYICDRKENKIIDFSRRFTMDKEQFDKLFCYRQINDLNYSEYNNEMANSDYDCCLFPLLFLSLNKLENNNNKTKSYKIGK